MPTIYAYMIGTDYTHQCIDFNICAVIKVWILFTDTLSGLCGFTHTPNLSLCNPVLELFSQVSNLKVIKKLTFSPYHSCFFMYELVFF